MSNRSLGPYAWMLCGCFSFAWMSQLAHLLGSSCDWRLVALARSFLAFSFALTAALLCGAQLVLWRPGILWLRSCAGSMSLLCTFYALPRLPTSEVLTLTNTFPIWVALLSWPLLRARPSPAVCLAAGCGVLGVVLIQRPHFEAAPDAHLAAPLALTAALSSAVAMLGLNRIKGVETWAIVVHFSGVATLIVLVACFTSGSPPPLSQIREGNNLFLLLGVGAAATVGQLCLTHAFTAGEPAKVSVVGLTQILFAMGLDMMFAESPFRSATTLAGIGLVVAPMAWVMTAKTG